MVSTERMKMNAVRRRHKLLPVKIARSIPPLGGQHGKGLGAIAYAKLFCPYSGITWYVTEFDGHDQCYGVVVGYDIEWGSFSLRELAEARKSFGSVWVPAIERDKSWRPTTLREAVAADAMAV